MLRGIDHLQQRLLDAEDFYRQRNVNMLAWRSLYFMQPESIWVDENGGYVEPEPDEERIVLPIPVDTVEGFRELLMTKHPAISVPAPTAEAEQLINAEHNEKVLLALWDRAEIYERLRDSLWHGLVDGWGVLQLVWNSKAKADEAPVTVLHHDPYNVYAMPGAKPNEWKYVIHAYPQLVGQVKDEWWPGSGSDKRKRSVKAAKAAFEGLKDTDEVTFIDYWDEDVNGVAISYDVEGPGMGETRIETKWVKEPTRHGYGFLPWEIYLPGRLPFRTVGERMGVGVLWVIEGLIPYMDRLISEKATMISRWQDPPLVTETELGPDFEPVRSEAGMHLRLGLNEKAAYLVHPGPMPQMDTMAMQVSENIETSALPRALQGLYMGAVSGIAMSLLRNPTLMKIAFRQKEVERCMERLDSKMLRLLEKKATKPLYLWGRGVNGAAIDVMMDPEQIGGYYRNEVKLSASLPTDDANTVNMLATLVQLKVLSRQTARDVAQQTLHDMVPQSLVDEEVKVLAEMIWQDPGLVQGLAKAAADKAMLPYLPTPENPKGGYGDASVGMPGGTQPNRGGPSGLPAGNTQPSTQQQIREMMEKSQASQTGAVTRPREAIE